MIDMTRKWYIIRTKSGHEKKVKEVLQQRITSMGLNEKIFRVVVPSEEIVEYRQNKKYSKERPYFTGYVFLEMILTDETYWAVKSTPGVSAFLGGTEPMPLPEEEVKNLLQLIEKPPETKPKPAIKFERDETVRITAGPFRHFVGTIEEVNEEKGKMKVNVSIFGRLTPLELSFSQVEKM